MIVEGYVAGQHASPYHGFSVEFAQHREYVAGDDVRHVDWKVWSKTDKYYLKQYEEETNLLTYLLLDTSESMGYASEGNVSKLQYAQYVAAALGYMVLRQQDSVGIALFDDAVRRMVRPSGQASHLKELLKVMDVTPAREKSDLGVVFHDLAERFKKRGVVVVLSDLLDEVPRILTGLKHLRHRRHEVIVFHILDPAEVDFPFRDVTLFQGMGGDARHRCRPPRPPAVVPGRVAQVPRRPQARLPGNRHRLRPLADQPGPRRPAVELPGIAWAPGPVMDDQANLMRTDKPLLADRRVEVAQADLQSAWAVLENLTVSLDQIGGFFADPAQAVAGDPPEALAVALRSYLSEELIRSIGDARAQLDRYIPDEDAEALADSIPYWDYAKVKSGPP